MLTQFALNNRTLMMAIVGLCLIAGPLSFLSHPAREDPSIVIRNAQVIASFPGMAAERVENLITRRLEEKLREIPEVKHIESVTSTGRAKLKVEVHGKYVELDPIWADLRNKMEDMRGELPSGTQGPLVFDDQGNVAMATIAITAEGFENYEMREAAKELRRLIYATVPGVRKVEFFGVEEQRVFVEFDNIRISQLGVDANSIVSSITRQNVILPGGRVEADGTTLSIEPTGDFAGLDDLESLSVRLDGDPPTTIYLRDIATVSLGYAEPAQTPAFYNGKPAVVVGVSMVDQVDSKVFSATLKALVGEYEKALPWGFELSFITFQQNEINDAVNSVLNNLWQTCVVVLLVVVAFLGLRTGLIVGAMVPLVMLMATLVMRHFEIELERMSLASLIISLGLLVDNGIVVAEDILGRIQRGQDRAKAALEAGRTLTLPLLAASVTTILAFTPLMLAEGSAGEYTRSISLVIAIALGISWVVALSVLMLICVMFMKAGEPVDEEAAYGRWYYQRYRGLLRGALRFRWGVVAIAICSLGFGGWLFQFVGKTFFPASERTQLQVIVELPVGANTNATMATVDRVADWLGDESQNPEVDDVVSYIGSGGPRFYLALQPPDGFSNNAYMIVNVKTSSDVITVRDRLKRWALTSVPEARVTPKEMSMGPSEVGLVEFRLVGDDSVILSDAADRIMAALREAPDTTGIKNDWENPTVALQVIVDQDAARRAGVSSEDIATALNTQLAGESVTDFRVDDVTIPVVLRAEGEQRTNVDRVRTLNVGVVGEAAIPLLQVARFDGKVGYSRIQRRDLRRVMTVSAKSTSLTAVALDAAVADTVAEVQASLPAGYSIEKGGELEGSSDAQGNLFASLPLAFGLMVLVLIWQFDSIRKPVIILLTIPLVLTGVSAGLLIFPGANFSFMGILGLLALAGIVINNAIMLLDRIDIELKAGRPAFEALVEAGVRRLRPIVMTTCTTALGLAPIILSRDVLFYDLAVVIAGGLVVGTVLTLVVAPCLYSILYRVRAT